MHSLHIGFMTLIDYLRDKNLTDAKFAESAGLSQSQISRLKRGIGRPSFEAMKSITDATGGMVRGSDWFPKEAKS